MVSVPVALSGAGGVSDLQAVTRGMVLHTTQGPLEAEHWRDADPDDVVKVMAPEIERAREAGVTALVEATPEGVGRRVDIDLAVSDATDFPIVVPTGIYQEPSIPQWARESTEDELTEWLVEDLTEGVDDTGVNAAWIKVSTDDDDPTGLSADEERILRAAASAGEQTGAVIGSHTLHGDVVHRQLDVIEEAGYTADRFIWIHAQADEERYHRQIAERGAYIEMLDEAGFTDQILLSQDRGWYDPSEPGGGDQNPYTYLTETFLPKLRDAGFDEGPIRQMTHENPFEAYSR